MRSSVLDSPEIGARAKEIADERLRAIVECQCRRPDDGGAVDASACPVHKPAAQAAADPLCGLYDPFALWLRQKEFLETFNRWLP